MKTVLANKKGGHVYTGRVSKWPDGLYTRADYPWRYITVYNAMGVFWSPNTSLPYAIEKANGEYTRVPGYTGRIESITPQTEGGAE